MNAGRSGTGVHWNKQALLIVGGAAVVLYAFYYLLPSFGPKYHDHSHKSWKTSHHQPIPQPIKDLQGKVTVSEHEVEITMSDNTKIKVFYREAPPLSPDSRVDVPVILLHGAGDDSLRWEKLGTMHLVAAMGHRIIAVDLPGWGRTEDEIDRTQEGRFLSPFFKAVNMERPVIVAASYGGNFAIPYLMEPDPGSCEKRARGFVPIATTATGRYTAAQYHRCGVPSMLVFGVNDTRLGLGMVGDLRNLLNNEIEPIEKAGHPVMFEQPERFHALIYNFLKTITVTQ